MGICFPLIVTNKHLCTFVQYTMKCSILIALVKNNLGLKLRVRAQGQAWYGAPGV